MDRVTAKILFSFLCCFVVVCLFIYFTSMFICCYCCFCVCVFPIARSGLTNAFVLSLLTCVTFEIFHNIRLSLLQLLMKENLDLKLIPYKVLATSSLHGKYNGLKSLSIHRMWFSYAHAHSTLSLRPKEPWSTGIPCKLLFLFEIKNASKYKQKFNSYCPSMLYE